MTDSKTIVIAIAVIFALYAGGCFDRAMGSTTNNVAPTVDTRACYADAQQQLSPQWAGANKLQRGIAILKVISICEGN